MLYSGAGELRAIAKGYKRTLRVGNTYCFSTATMIERTRLIVTLHIHCLSCYFMGGKYGQNLQTRDE